MGYHEYTRPTTWVTLTTLTRSGFVFDADRVGTSTRFYFEYVGGIVSSTFTAANGTSLTAFATDRGMRTTVFADRWDAFTGGWEIQSNKARCTATGRQRIATDGSGTTAGNIDVSAEVLATAEAGLYLRGNGGSSWVDVTVDVASGRIKGREVLPGVSVTTVFTGTTVVSASVPYTLRVVTSGTTFSVYLNGVFEGSFSSSLNSTLTNCGLSTISDTGARFDDFFLEARTAVAATSYEVRNYDGDVLATGAVSGAYLDIADSVLTQRNGRGPYGWYRLYLYGTDRNDGQWEDSYGACSFYRAKPNSNFPDNPARTQAVAGHPNTDEYARAVMAVGPNRYAITPASITAGSATVDIIETAVATAKTMWVDLASANRPRRTIVAWPQGTAGNEANVTAIVNRLKTWVKAWEGFNEPSLESQWTYPPTNGSLIQDYIDDELVPFYNAVKAADATAVVLAPNPVSINISNTGTRWLRKFVELTAGMSPRPYDALSVHVYNSSNGDLSMAQNMMAETLDILADNGLTGLPIYQTEQGFGYQYSGLYTPRFNGRWTMLQVFVQELYGLPLDQNFYWYDTFNGFADFPFHWLSPEGPGPSGLLLRTMVAETYGKAIATRFDFGSNTTSMYAGGRWDGSDGTSTVGLIGASNNVRALTLTVTGASSLTAVDPWGNTFTVNVTAGQASFPVNELPQWIRVPAGVTVVPVSVGLTTNLALTATASSTGRATRINVINDGIQENAYQYSVGDISTDPGDYPYFHSPYLGDAALPQTLTLTWPAPITANRLIFYAFPPWQEQGTATEFDIDTWDGSTWTTRYTQAVPQSKTFPFTSGDAHCTVETYWDDRWIFDVSFTAASFSKVRVVIRAYSYGGTENDAAHVALWGSIPGAARQSIVVRELQAFNVVSAAPPVGSGQRTSGAIFVG